MNLTQLELKKPQERIRGNLNITYRVVILMDEIEFQEVIEVLWEVPRIGKKIKDFPGIPKDQGVTSQESSQN
ncbi:hypothetical protein pdam_00014131 [Pocillopora damicornis]|uniref:Uncharacterized protein n=1 Tax=Pocillopora damicornis TaxID=46731 RepID=A0A3M6UM85_POCDA|nr:hypothetical protein pdam_00014131 [Pocillopora damicornis]